MYKNTLAAYTFNDIVFADYCSIILNFDAIESI